LKRWGVEKSLAPADMIEARDRLHKFIQDKYPEVIILREWPITLRNAENQLMHGWIDMLLELPDSYVIIDHKSYPGADAEEHAKQFAPQLAIYKEAIEKATGKDVVATLVHMPVVGKVFEVS
jgi:ATP-dependent exoDNAse (exonuclease V) beta subunit